MARRYYSDRERDAKYGRQYSVNTHKSLYIEIYMRRERERERERSPKIGKTITTMRFSSQFLTEKPRNQHRKLLALEYLYRERGLPESTEVGMECWRRRTNLNILSPAGRKPSLSAKVTIPSPAGGTSTSRPIMIAVVVRIPSFELPGPVHHSQEILSIHN